MRVDVGNTVHCYHQPPTIITMASKPIKHPYNYCFDKHDLHIYARQHLHPFNCTRNSFHYHSTICCSYRLENLRIPTHGLRFGIKHSGCQSPPLFIKFPYCFDSSTYHVYDHEFSHYARISLLCHLTTCRSYQFKNL